MSGLELLRWLSHSNHGLPAIMITGDSDVPMAVRAMKAGAWDFIEKPIGHRETSRKRRECARDSRGIPASCWHLSRSAAGAIAGLTPRQRQIMELVLAGHPQQKYLCRSRH
ncbi:MAG: response regulator [Bradyrhizobium sp.]